MAGEQRRVRRVAGYVRPRPTTETPSPPKTLPERLQPWIGVVGGIAAVVALSPTMYTAARDAWFSDPPERSAAVTLSAENMHVDTLSFNSPRIRGEMTVNLSAQGWQGQRLRSNTVVDCHGKYWSPQVAATDWVPEAVSDTRVLVFSIDRPAPEKASDLEQITCEATTELYGPEIIGSDGAEEGTFSANNEHIVLSRLSQTLAVSRG